MDFDDPKNDGTSLSPKDRSYFENLPGFDLASLERLLKQLEPSLGRQIVGYLLPTASESSDQESRAPIRDGVLDLPRVPSKLATLLDDVLSSRPYHFDLKKHDEARDRAVRRFNAVPLLLGSVRTLGPSPIASIIVRYPRPESFEALLLPEENHTVGAIASAVTGLFREWRTHGRVPTVERSVPVHSPDPPQDFSVRFMNEVLAPKLALLGSAPLIRLDPFGDVRVLPLSIISSVLKLKEGPIF